MRRADSLEKTLMLGKIEGGRRRGRQRMRWLDGTGTVSVSSRTREDQKQQRKCPPRAQVTWLPHPHETHCQLLLQAVKRRGGHSGAHSWGQTGGGERLWKAVRLRKTGTPERSQLQGFFWDDENTCSQVGHSDDGTSVWLHSTQYIRHSKWRITLCQLHSRKPLFKK